MSSLLAETSATSPVADLHACLDRLVDPAGLSDAQHALVLADLARAKARLAAYEMKVLAAADRARVSRSTGHASTCQWAASTTRVDEAVVARQVRLSRGLEQRTLTQVALAAGEINAEHAAVIVRADELLPTSVSPQQRATIECALIEKARTVSPGVLRRTARRALAEVEQDEAAVDAHEDDLVRAEEERARSRVRLTLHDNEDGTVSGHFTVPTLQGHLLRKILHSMTAPRRGRLGASSAQVGDNTGLRTSADRARGEAFCELIEHLPTDHLTPRTAASLVVTVELETLRGALKVAGLDTGESLSAGEARRLACTSSIIPLILGGGSVPLDLGRSARLFSEAQRTALATVHQACAADGCERPFAWCELHHRQPWSQGGRTDLHEAVPLCHFHHQRIHDPQYQHSTAPDGTMRFRLRTELSAGRPRLAS